MFENKEDLDKQNVFGDTYVAAKNAVALVEYTIRSQDGRGFASKELCEKFAKDNHLDFLVFMKSIGSFRAVTHTGETLLPREWKKMYRSILFYTVADEDGKTEIRYWEADSYASFENARIYGEVSDGIRQPLYYRDYFVPTGYFSETQLAFNVAKPITVFAAETNADTSHIHELIKRISGDLYMYVLAWLRHKMVYPTRKTFVIPIFTGGQGTGKSTFGEVICKALFGVDNVIVTDSYDSNSRFNSDQIDALVIAIEEKTQDDKRNTAAALKSKATASQVRNERKGVDPFYQESYTDFVMSTNEFVPIKFEDSGRQRRFMVMEGDRTFRRETNPVAEEVFTKLYGYNGAGDKVCKGLIEDKPVLQQFKKELWDLGTAVDYKQFPETEAYKRCFDLPRTNDAVEIDFVIKALAPLIKESLEKRAVQQKMEIVDENGTMQTIYLDSLISNPAGVQFVPAYTYFPDRIAVNKQLLFQDINGKPLAHAVVDRVLLDLRAWFEETYNLILLPETRHPTGGFTGIATRHRYSPAAWFTLKSWTVRDPEVDRKEELKKAETGIKTQIEFYKAHTPVEDELEVVRSLLEEGRTGTRIRFNGNFQPDPEGEFETLNELKPGVWERKSSNCAHMDTFLLEADETTQAIEAIEKRRLIDCPPPNEQSYLSAEQMYAERLKIQYQEALRMFDSGKACRIVYSGTKSLHILIRVKDSPENKEERDWLDAYLKTTASHLLDFDPVTKDPSRLTRAPITRERVAPFIHNPSYFTMGKQKLIACDWTHIHDIAWRPMYFAWKHQPPLAYEERGKLMPTKQIYKEAVFSILDGTFFTAYKWTGQRQQMFFPAYRLLREMGYSHEELWTELHKQMDMYKKTKERNYWHTRETCALIKEIDEEIDSVG